MRIPAYSARAPLLLALAGTLLVLFWQFLTVHYNYGGNWTAFFCTGDKMQVPPALASETVYRFPNSFGYDGQVYHYIAHDPFLTRGLDRYVDAPRFRYRRIGVPLLAFLFAAGNQSYIDTSYHFVILLFLFLGIYWTARLAARQGVPPAWGLAFLFVPAAAISIDRNTVDIALAALCVAFVLYVLEDRQPAVWVILLLAPLVRETGVCLTVGYISSALLARRFTRAAWSSATVLPFVAWCLWLLPRTPVPPGGMLGLPFAGILYRLAHPTWFPFGVALNAVLVVLDTAALLAVVAAIGLALRFLWKRSLDPISLALAAFAALAVLSVHPNIWAEPFGFARTFSPLLVVAAARACEFRNWRYAVPLAIALPAVGIRFGSQVVGILRGLL